jgi:hypothetical protein
MIPSPHFFVLLFPFNILLRHKLHHILPLQLCHVTLLKIQFFHGYRVALVQQAMDCCLMACEEDNLIDLTATPMLLSDVLQEV